MSEQDDIYNRIIEKLSSKIKSRYTCPICHNQEANMVISDGLFYNPLQSFDIKDGRSNPSGLQIPTCVLICSHCGFLSQHAVLALFDSEDKYLEVIKAVFKKEK